MPEWMTSGDASNNNLASSLVAESPFVKAAEAEQHFYGSAFVELIWKALGILQRSHPIEGVRTLGDLRRLFKIDFHPAEVASRDQMQQAQVNQIADQQGWKSKRTISTEMGNDYDAESEEIAKQPKPVEPGIGPAQNAGLPSTEPLQRDPDADIEEEPPPNISSTQALNGAQITAVQGVFADLGSGAIAPDVAVELLVAVGLEQPRAQAMVDSQLKQVDKQAASPGLQGAITGAAEAVEETKPDVAFILREVAEDLDG